MTPRIEITVLADSAASLLTPQVMLVPVDLIGTVADISSQAGDAQAPKVRITLREACDRLVGPEDAPVVVHGQRTLLALESYSFVCTMLSHAANL